MKLGLGLNITNPLSSGKVFAKLFADNATPALVSLDVVPYELGVKFVSTVAGKVTALRYWRGAGDDGDTDTRELRLWNAAGTQLAVGTCVSTPGAVGWQQVAITPVTLTVGDTYVASYGTTGNYAVSSSFFVTPHVGPGGILTAISGTNGVFTDIGLGIFPNQSFNSTNYWVEPLFEIA